MKASDYDLILVGGGIMSTTLATLIHLIDSSQRIAILEQAPELGRESSDGWHNAGTGHAGFCELNYTPADSSGHVDISRACSINARFEVSMQFWASLAQLGIVTGPLGAVRSVPHLSWVTGEAGVRFLRERFRALQQSPFFEGMEYSESPRLLSDWLPLMHKALDHTTPMAATRMVSGTDVDFGRLTRQLGRWLAQHSAVDILCNHRVTELQRTSDGWQVKAKGGEQPIELSARRLFLGAGGATLSLLQLAGVPEARGYGAFPVSGLWLASTHQDMARLHNAKVYGQAPVGAPPMSVPHLDSRYLEGKAALLFGPFAGLTSRFLRAGSGLDLVRSVRLHNLMPMARVGLEQHTLTRYLLREGLSRFEDRFAQLQTFLPDARPEDWALRTAGQRVQIIRCQNNGRPELAFGTEVLTSKDGSLSALLGASPGASVSVDAMLEVLSGLMPELQTGLPGQRLRDLIPVSRSDLLAKPQQIGKLRERNSRLLGLQAPSVDEPRNQYWSGAA
ncbi:MAG: malate:quinone oxidoreductase [Natronospirillum sp.]|uniref:malate:quinone oxidoreductase n=1 Tax=Natronospirillum sp. TaxID=2812955 RepID=UPI0025EA7133|nr:malate:quinone oxidoreductase [Natronospirillum sp.]MCH8550336.1 malate:quinone oxidoreductase [Natronospirillum sp.]